jgi:hypothetical protein
VRCRTRGYLLKDSVAAPEQLVTAVGRSPRVARHRPLVVEAMLGAGRGRRLAAGRLSRGSGGAGRDGERAQQLRDRGPARAHVRAVERHINSIFAKLGLAEEEDYHRRVRAVLLFLAER